MVWLMSGIFQELFARLKKNKIKKERKRIEKLFNNFSKMLDSNDITKIDEYLHKVTLIFENEVDKFGNLSTEECNSLDSKILRSDMVSNIRGLMSPEQFRDTVFASWFSTIQSYSQDNKLEKFGDRDFSIFGSAELNLLVSNCYKKFTNWRKNNPLKEDIDAKEFSVGSGWVSRVFMSIKNLGIARKKILSLNNKSEINKEITHLDSYFYELFQFTGDILDELKAKIEINWNNFEQKRDFLDEGKKIFSNSKGGNIGKK